MGQDLEAGPWGHPQWVWSALGQQGAWKTVLSRTSEGGRGLLEAVGPMVVALPQAVPPEGSWGQPSFYHPSQSLPLLDLLPSVHSTSLPLYSFSMASITNCHKFSHLKQCTCIILQFFRSNNWHGSHWAEVKVSAGLSSRRLQGESLFLLIQVVCWQNSLPCSCRTEVLASLLAVT